MPLVVKVDPDSQCRDAKFIEQMGSLLDDHEHCDVTFFVGPSKTEVGASFRGLIAPRFSFASNPVYIRNPAGLL